MTGLAVDFRGTGMGSSEGKVRSFMIEGPVRDRCNILTSTFVFCVTVLAFPLLLDAPVGALL